MITVVVMGHKTVKPRVCISGSMCVKLVVINQYIEVSDSSIELDDCSPMQHPVVVHGQNFTWVQSVANLHSTQHLAHNLSTGHTILHDDEVSFEK